MPERWGGNGLPLVYHLTGELEMPTRPQRPCREPMCAGKTREKHGYCERHADKAVGWKRHQAGQKTTARGYGRPWRRLRKAVLERDKYLCQPCRQAGRVAQAGIVDHILPKAEGGTDSDDNLQSICEPCHKAKTQQEAQRARHGGRKLEPQGPGGR